MTRLRRTVIPSLKVISIPAATLDEPDHTVHTPGCHPGVSGAT